MTEPIVRADRSQNPAIPRVVDLARFRDEAQANASLRHAHIVQVYETGEFRDQPFFSLEFCAGGTLARALGGEPQPARTTIQSDLPGFEIEVDAVLLVER